MQKRQNKHPDPTPWLFLGPSLCGVTLFVLAPFVETVRRSVTDTMGRHFVGLANYTAVLGNDAFRLAVENTVRFIGVLQTKVNRKNEKSPAKFTRPKMGITKQAGEKSHRQPG